jgi:hypothetical protein
MGDNRYYAAYARNADGSCTYSPLYEYSPKKYAMNRIEKSSDQNMKALCVALLNYGAAAQTYFGYKTDDLMNADLTAGQKALIKAYSADLLVGAVAAEQHKTGTFVKTDAGFRKRSATVSFEGAFAINYYFTPDRVPEGEITFYYWTAADYEAAEVLTADNATGSCAMLETDAGSYWAEVTGIPAKSIDDTVYAAAVYTSGGETCCTGVIAYSLSTYCKKTAAGTSLMQPLAAATGVYGYYAKVYFGNGN